MRRILISNDDGIYGNGLKPLIRALYPLGKLYVIVPDGERSAAGHSITLHKPYRVQGMPIEISKNHVIRAYMSNGTPADCVRFGVHEVLKNKKVDLIVGGINQGPNLGEDIVYSGTVAVAREGAMNNIPSVAFSVTTGVKSVFERAAKAAKKIAQQLLTNKLPQNIFLNVNVPPFHNSKGSKEPFEITRLGRRVYGKDIPHGVDPRGHLYYWLAGDTPRGIPLPGTDMAAMKKGKVSITPLSVDGTNYRFISELLHWKF